jgi:hypothetical protein
MTSRDRALYHQIHPAKLLTDWSTAVAAGALLWQHRALLGLVVGFGPSVATSLLFLLGGADRQLERLRTSYLGRTVAPYLAPDVNALRLAGLGVFWGACWLHRAWLLLPGLAVILGGWALAWRRGVLAHSSSCS